MASSTKNSLSVLFMVFILVAVVGEVANASSLTVWRLGNCGGESQTLSACGCSNLLYMGGYQFSYTGQTARMYNTGNCQGAGTNTLNGNDRRCLGVGWRSINIQC
ncbi:hypothetical protein MKX01_014581 [Papaver californicum]|nr:hypothetical protein MKX01_014581 [Papaver californicum]